MPVCLTLKSQSPGPTQGLLRSDCVIAGAFPSLPESQFPHLLEVNGDVRITSLNCYQDTVR